jgi:platelet-activating factor acetylhydrolase
MKSVFYRPSTGDPPKSYTPIYVPLMNSSLVKQITTSSTLVLLDPWGLPLVNKKTAWLNDKPLPGYRREKDAGRNILAVLSEAFFKWNANLVAIKRLLSEDPSAPRSKQKAGTGAYVFYPAKAAHLSQSDFGVLVCRRTILTWQGQLTDDRSSFQR